MLPRGFRHPICPECKGDLSELADGTFECRACMWSYRVRLVTRHGMAGLETFDPREEEEALG